MHCSIHNNHNCCIRVCRATEKLVSSCVITDKIEPSFRIGDAAFHGLRFGLRPKISQAGEEADGPGTEQDYESKWLAAPGGRPGERPSIWLVDFKLIWLVSWKCLAENGGVMAWHSACSFFRVFMVFLVLSLRLHCDFPLWILCDFHFSALNWTVQQWLLLGVSNLLAPAASSRGSNASSVPPGP